ncbi:cation transporting ATPase C-terminal domain-containing protein [Amphibacillus indicireducens]
MTLLIIVPFLADIFDFTQISLGNWLFTVGISLLPFVYIELKKKADLFN